MRQSLLIVSILLLILGCVPSVDPELKTLLQEAKLAETNGNEAFAIGKYRKTYAQYPSQTQIPFIVAGLYAQIAQKNPSSQVEKQKSIEWLYRARLVDPSLTLTQLKQPPFSVLKKEPSYQSLLRNYGEGASGFSLQIISKKIDDLFTEVKWLALKMRNFFSALYRVGNWIGFQVVFFFFCMLLVNFLLRQLGFSLGIFLWLCSFTMVSLGWYFAIRVVSGGASDGREVIGQVLLYAVILFVVLFTFRFLASWIWFFCRRLWITSNMHRSWIQKSHGDHNRNIRSFLFHLEEVQADLMKKGHQLLSLPKDTFPHDEKKKLALEIEVLRQKIQALVAHPIEEK